MDASSNRVCVICGHPRRYHDGTAIRHPFEDVIEDAIPNRAPRVPGVNVPKEDRRPSTLDATPNHAADRWDCKEDVMKYRLILEAEVPTAVRWDGDTTPLTAQQKLAVADVVEYLRDAGGVVDLLVEPREGLRFSVFGEVQE